MSHADDKAFLVRDESGRGCAAEWTMPDVLARWTTDELSYSEVTDEDDFGFLPLRQWLEECDVGEEFANTDENWTMIRIR